MWLVRLTRTYVRAGHKSHARHYTSMTPYLSRSHNINQSVVAMAQLQSEEELLRRIKELEYEVVSLKSAGPRRSRIKEMSAEVVDSNPYRYYNLL